jgi:aminoglycoside phosphotransferase (APT) family kinase protein
LTRSQPADQAAAELFPRLSAYLRSRLSSKVEVTNLSLMAGGASRETWAFDALLPGGPSMPLILRRDPAGRPSARGYVGELRLLRSAEKAGVPVPTARWAESGPIDLGASFILMDRVEGETIPRRILRAIDSGERARLLDQCAVALARIHRMPTTDVDFLGPAQQPTALLEAQLSTLDALGEPHPVFELALRWLLTRAPSCTRPAVVHGDFRLGNVIVGAEGLRAVLDWELAHLGRPAEDLGWFCVQAWRFGVDHLPAGGLGTREQLLGAYAAAGGDPPDLDELRFWEVYGSLRWGIICLLQASFHLSGATPSVELAAIGRRACEMEWALLDLMEAG